jgi:ornithine cyclodeaminase
MGGHAQCVTHGEFGWVVRSGLVAREKAFPLGQALAQSEPDMTGSGIRVVDLTGLGAQDLALASFVYQKLAS